MSWIPNPLPPQVKLIVTTHRDVNITKTFKHLPKPPEWYRLSHLDKDEAKVRLFPNIVTAIQSHVRMYCRWSSHNICVMCHGTLLAREKRLTRDRRQLVVDWWLMNWLDWHHLNGHPFTAAAQQQMRRVEPHWESVSYLPDWEDCAEWAKATAKLMWKQVIVTYSVCCNCHKLVSGHMSPDVLMH